MIDFSKSCVFCDSTEDLNTVMTISIDDKDYKIAVGDSCEDEALPKKIKEALKIKIEADKKKQLDKDAKLEALKEAAAEFGFELAPVGSSKLMIPTKLEVQTAPPKDLSNAPVIEQNGGKFVVQKNTRDAATPRTIPKGMGAAQAKVALEVAQQNSASGFPSSEIGGATEYQSHVLPESAQTRRGVVNFKPETITKINQTVPGRLGIPTVIPEKIIGADGSTEIKIVKSGGDNLIQRRMKALNQARMGAEGAGMPASAQPHDRIHNCMSCNGSGDVKGRVCIRCQGAGFIGIM